MTITKLATGGHRNTIICHAEKPFLVPPKIIGRKIKIDGQYYYRGMKTKGRRRYFLAEQFDRMFRPQIANKIIKEYRYNGENPDQKNY